MAHRIIPRSEWGARYKGGFYDRAVGNLRRYLHHSVTIAPDLVPPFTDDYAAVRELEAIGQSRFSGGISYTFVISPAGLIFEGHGIGRIGSHTEGYNTIAAGICFIGNYEKDRPTPQQLAALDWLLHEGVREDWWTSPTLTGGHRDTKSTACPGENAYAEIPEINAGRYHNVTVEAEEGFLMELEPEEQRAVYNRVNEIKRQQDRMEEQNAKRHNASFQRERAMLTEISALSALAKGLAEDRGVDGDALVDAVKQAAAAAAREALSNLVLPLEGEITLTPKET